MIVLPFCEPSQLRFSDTLQNDCFTLMWN